MWELKAAGQFVDWVCCRCGIVSVDSLLSRGRWEQVRCLPNPGTPIKINLVLSRLSGGLGMSLYSPTVYNPPPQLSSPCNLTWIVWLWDVLKINNKMWQELDTFTNTEEKLFWLKPQNHIDYLLALQHCTRWEHISFCVNHACMFLMFWKFMGESFLDTQQKNVKTLNCSRWGIVRTPAPGFWSVSESAHGLVWLWITESHWHQDFNQ